jgi:hypothetical protein
VTAAALRSAPRSKKAPSRCTRRPENGNSLGRRPLRAGSEQGQGVLP